MNQGEVEITLGGKTETLKSTLRAAKEVNAALGGFTEAFRKLIAFDLQAYSVIIAAGLGKKPSEVENDVWTAGMSNLSDSVSQYLSYLSNGGREYEEKKDAKPGEA